MSDLWIEKYRPKDFSEIKGNKKIIERIEAFVRNKSLPHILLSGPAGCGKTTLSLIIARRLYGNEWKGNFLELNASDDRGIDVIRNTIKDFARIKAMGGQPFKIIYLDECDSLTKEAQQALRRTMESFVASTRFILSCNYSSKILDPIQSRCAIFRFQKLKEEEIREVVKEIAAKEGLTLEEDAAIAIAEIASGDVRRATNVLQSCASNAKKVTREVVYELVSAAEPKEILTVLEKAVAGDFIKSRDLLFDIMLKHGLSGIDTIKQVQKEIWNLKIDDAKKVALIDCCGEIEFRMVEGSDEFIQLEALLANFVKC
ncbi:replication factor C small subunit [Candidatus Woesearchaeota archaeon]|nr:replication factor C small subunit [Candidatus Woesearchaeota archaeon]